MSRFVLIAVLVAGCSATVEGTVSTTEPTQPPTTSQAVLTFDVDQWTGEVEWDIVEQCSLLGLSNCAVRVADMKAGECSVNSTRQVLESLASTPTQEHLNLLETLDARSDCAGLGQESWQLSRP